MKKVLSIYLANASAAVFSSQIIAQSSTEWTLLKPSTTSLVEEQDSTTDEIEVWCIKRSFVIRNKVEKHKCKTVIKSEKNDCVHPFGIYNGDDLASDIILATGANGE